MTKLTIIAGCLFATRPVSVTRNTIAPEKLVEYRVTAVPIYNFGDFDTRDYPISFDVQ